MTRLHQSVDFCVLLRKLLTPITIERNVRGFRRGRVYRFERCYAGTRPQSHGSGRGKATVVYFFFCIISIPIPGDVNVCTSMSATFPCTFKQKRVSIDRFVRALADTGE